MSKFECQIQSLTDYNGALQDLARIWYEQISKHWVPGASIEKALQNLEKHKNESSLPMAFIALHDNKPIGMAALRENDGIREELKPWLGSLVVDKPYQGKGVGKSLIEAVKNNARKMQFEELFLLAFDLTIPQWYSKLGWKEIGKDKLFGHQVTVMSTKLYDPGLKIL